MDLRDCVKKTRIKCIICIIASFLALILVWLFPIKHALNKHLNSTYIEKWITQSTNLPVYISQIDYKTHPDFSLSLNTASIKISDNSNNIANITNLSTRINIINLILNKITIKDLKIDNLTFNLTRDKDGNYTILKILNLKNNKLKKNIKINNLHVKNYNITNFDENTNEKLKLNGNDFIIQDYSPNKNINISTKGTLFLSKTTKEKNIGSFDIKLNTQLPLLKNLNKKDFDIQIKIKDFNLSPISSFIKPINNSAIKEINGNINADIKTEATDTNKLLIGTIKTKDLLLKNQKGELSAILKENLNANFNATILKDNILLNTVTFQTTHNNINIDGIISHTATKPLMDINITLHNDSNHMLYHAIPSELKFENNLISKIKKYQPIATFDGKLNLKGNFLTPDIIGEITTDELYINQPLAKEAKAKLKLIFNKKRTQLIGQVIPNKETTVDIEGAFNIYGEKNAVFNIKSTPNASLPIVRAVLLPIQDAFSLNFGILNQLLITKGYGDADLKISGTRKNSVIDGRLNFNNAEATLIGIDAIINNANGYLDFKGKNINFTTTNATIKNHKINILGNAKIHGPFEININSPEIKTNILLNIIKNSQLLKNSVQNPKALEQIKSILGSCSLNMNIKGSAENALSVIGFDSMHYTGEVNLNNNKLTIKDFYYPITLNNSNITFSKENIKTATNAKILNSAFNLDAVLKQNDTSLEISSDKFELQDLISLFYTNNIYKKLLNESKNKIYTKFKLTYTGQTEKLDLSKISLYANLFSSEIEPFYTTLGTIILKNGHTTIDKLTLDIYNTKLILDGIINNIFDKKTDYEIKCELNNFDVESLNNLQTLKILRNDIKKIITAYENYKGKIKGNIIFKPKQINGKLSVQNIGFTHKKMQLPVSFSNTDIFFNGNTISIPTIHGIVDNIPFLIKLDIKNFLTKPQYEGYLTTNLYPSFINKYINTNLGYPIKLKGELQFKSYFNANTEDIKTTTILNFPINSDISYMGSSIDDKEFEREIKLEMVQKANIFKIHKATLAKYIRAQNGQKTKYPYVSASGTIQADADDIRFNNFNIKTHEYTNSKIFNILFKKSILKYGKFDCDLNINGPYTNPHILGHINFKNLDMPLYETIVKDIFATFKQNNIDLKIFGTVFDTEITAKAEVKNNLTLPLHIKSLNINAGYLDLDNVFNSLSTVSLKSPSTISDSQQNIVQLKTTFLPIIIDKGIISAEKVLVRGFPATNLISNIKLGQNGILNVQDFNFNFVQGSIKTKGAYDFNTNILEGNCTVQNIDANNFSQIFLNLKNQIFGNLDGTVYFKTQGTTPTERLEKLNGKIEFKILDGKMPKLGSLEYLLRAANLIKSGITGFTINNMIDLLIPVKTGNFSQITGNMIITDGNAQNIEISSAGENLSLYITGNADIINQNAQMIVLGRLSKKLSTILGPVGNASLNTLFNFIPGITMSEKENTLIKELNKIPFLELSNSNDYRFFQATIDGDLNSDEFVQTFKWLE